MLLYFSILSKKKNDALKPVSLRPLVVAASYSSKTTTQFHNNEIFFCEQQVWIQVHGQVN